MAIFKKKNKNLIKIYKNFLSLKKIKRTSIYYFLRLTRLEASVYSVSAGFACGAMVSFTPFIGFHFLLALIVAYFLRGNLIASMIGTIVGNPFTFPIIWLFIFRIGSIFTPQSRLNINEKFDFSNVLDGGWEILFPMLVGSAIICIPIWFISFFTIRFLINSFRRKKS